MGFNKRILTAIDRELKDKYRSKKYSKSLSATNSLFAPNDFFRKPSTRRIYNPNAKYFKKGGQLTLEEAFAIHNQDGGAGKITLKDFAKLVPKSDWGMTFAEMAKKYGWEQFKHGGPHDPPQESTESQREWMINYIQSPMYLKRLSKEFPEYSNEELESERNARLSNVNNVNIKYPRYPLHPDGYGNISGEYYAKNIKPGDFTRRISTGELVKDEIDNSKSGNLYLETPYRPDVWIPEEGYNTIPLHEIGHAADDGGFRIPYKTEKLIYDSTNKAYAGPFNYDVLPWDNATKMINELPFKYKNTPTEFVNRLIPLRYELERAGIWKPGEEDFIDGMYNLMLKNPDVMKNTHIQDVLDSIPGANDSRSKRAIVTKLLNEIALNDVEQDLNVAKYGGPKIKQRRGVRKNPDGSVSSHLMRAEYIPERGWVGFPSLFQDSKPYADDQQNWVDMSEEEDWMKIYEEAERRDEVYDFGEDKEAALAFGEGSWKDQDIQSPEAWEQKIRRVEREIGHPRGWTMDDYHMMQDKLNEYKAWRERHPEVIDHSNEPNEYVVPLPPHLNADQYMDVELSDEEVEQYKAGGYILEEMHEGGPSHSHPHEDEVTVTDSRKDLPSKYYDKDGNLIEDVPSYGTIYTSDPNDPRIQEFKDRLHLYNLSKNNYLDVSRSEIDESIKGLEEDIEDLSNAGEFDLVKENEDLIKSLIQNKKNISGKNYINHYRNAGRIEAGDDFFDDAISGNLNLRDKNYKGFDSRNRFLNEEREEEILKEGLKLGYKPYINYSNNKGAALSVEYPYPSLTVKYADPEKYDWAKPVEEEPEIEIDRLPVLEPEMIQDTSLPEELVEGEDFNNDYKTKRVVDKIKMPKINKRGKIRRGPFGTKTTRSVRYEPVEEEQIYPEGFVPRLMHEGGPSHPHPHGEDDLEKRKAEMRAYYKKSAPFMSDAQIEMMVSKLDKEETSTSAGDALYGKKKPVQGGPTDLKDGNLVSDFKKQQTADNVQGGKTLKKGAKELGDIAAEFTYKPIVRTAKKAYNDPIGLIKDLGTTATDIQQLPFTLAKESYDYFLGDGKFEGDKIFDPEAAAVSLDALSVIPVAKGLQTGVKTVKPLLKYTDNFLMNAPNRFSKSTATVTDDLIRDYNYAIDMQNQGLIKGVPDNPQQFDAWLSSKYNNKPLYRVVDVDPNLPLKQQYAQAENYGTSLAPKNVINRGRRSGGHDELIEGTNSDILYTSPDPSWIGPRYGGKNPFYVKMFADQAPKGRVEQVNQLLKGSKSNTNYVREYPGFHPDKVPSGALFEDKVLSWDGNQITPIIGRKGDKLRDAVKVVSGSDFEKLLNKKFNHGGEYDTVELGDEVDEATMQRLKKQGYTFEEI